MQPVTLWLLWVPVISIILHCVGDYCLQSDWMAAEKTKRSWPALAHAFVYTVPFVILTRSIVALMFIMVTHFLIDRFRLIRYLCWAKNFLAPKGYNKPWKDCKATGYPSDKPAWLTVWLMIIADNTLHLACNSFALIWL